MSIELYRVSFALTITYSAKPSTPNITSIPAPPQPPSIPMMAPLGALKGVPNIRPQPAKLPAKRKVAPVLDPDPPSSNRPKRAVRVAAESSTTQLPGRPRGKGPTKR